MSGDVTAQVREQFRRAAVGWERWGDTMQRDDAARYIEAAAIASGDRVLEVGAGTGEQTLALAEHVGPEGRIVATDLSPEMLDVAARRVSEAGFDNVQFVNAGVEELDLKEPTFDACVSGFTWLFLPDPLAGAVKVKGLLTEGGRIAASVWGPMPNLPMMTVAGAVIMSELVVPRPGPSEGVDLADPNQFNRVLTEAGFRDVSVTEFPVSLRWATPIEYAQSMRELAPQLQDLIEANAPQRTQEIWDAVAQAAEDYVTDDGTVRMVNQAFMGAGERPV